MLLFSSSNLEKLGTSLDCPVNRLNYTDGLGPQSIKIVQFWFLSFNCTILIPQVSITRFWSLKYRDCAMVPHVS